jgi:hypothetical protein
MSNLVSPMMKVQEGKEFSLVQFKWETEKNNFQSTRVGRPIHDKYLKAYITSPGMKNQVAVLVIERHLWQGDDVPAEVKVNHELRDRYRTQLGAWEAGNADVMTGTPLSELKSLDVSWQASLREMGIHTIESLAGLQDGALFMGGRPLRDQARAYLEQAKGMEPVAALAAENETMRNQIAHLTEQVETLTALLSSDDESAPRRGRPRKDAAA